MTTEQHYIQPKKLFWLLASVTVFSVICLAYAELPGAWWEAHPYLIAKFIMVHAGLEILRAAILTVNVQIMKVSGNRKYYIVLALTIIASIGIAISIYLNHAQNWSDPFMWASQVLNFLVFSGELSLSFLLAGQKVDYLEEYQEAKKTLDSNRHEIDSLRLEIDSVRESLDSHRLTLGDISRLLDIDREAIEDNSLFIETLSQALDKHRKAIGELRDRDRLSKSQLRLYKGFNKISIDGVKASACKDCGSISPAPSNKASGWECPVCNSEIVLS